MIILDSKEFFHSNVHTTTFTPNFLTSAALRITNQYADRTGVSLYSPQPLSPSPSPSKFTVGRHMTEVDRWRAV